MTFEAWVQSRLTAHGYPCGMIDGNIGPITRAALRAFQAARGLPQTGVGDAGTVAALRAPSSLLPAGETRPEGMATDTPVIPAWPTQANVRAFYGEVGTSQGKLDLPFPMRLAWAKDQIVTRITLHAKVIESAGRAFEAIASAYGPVKRAELGLDLFGGSLNVRRMRGGSAWSMHAWGIAIDFDPERNQLNWGRGKARLAQPDADAFWAAWEREGWVSLGRARNFDWMHVQAARL